MSAREKLIALMAVYNEIDILEETLHYHATHGIKFLILDNGSTDGSFELATKLRHNMVIEVRRLQTENYAWALLLETLSLWGEEYDSEWTFLIDADTFLESPWHGVSLPDALERVTNAGCNVVNFDNYEFWPVKDGATEGSVQARLRYYSWSDSKQEKCWRSTQGTRNHRTGGHVVDFPPQLEKRIYPTNFVMRHYPIRSVEHGTKKIFGERVPRFVGEPAGWHVQYDGFVDAGESLLKDKERLVERIEGAPWVRERLLRCRSVPPEP